MSAEQIDGLLPYLLPGQTVGIELFEGRPAGLNPPATVDLEVMETEPALKGATASASYKPAKLETGLTIQVPPFIRIGDRVRLDPSRGEYLERVS